MSDSSPQSEPQSNTAISTDRVWKQINDKLFGTGIPTAFVALAIDRLRQSEVEDGLKFFGAAFLVWFLSGIIGKLAPKFDIALDILIEKPEFQLNRGRFKKKYLEAIRTYCFALQIEGFRGKLPFLPLKEIFVPLSYAFDPDTTHHRKNIIKGIWDLLPKDKRTKEQSINKRLVIIAPPGYGKTTLTRYLTLSYADRDYRNYKAKALIPFLLLFRTIHSQIIDDTNPLLPELIAQSLNKIPGCQDLNPSQEWLVDWLKSGECLVMLDGLDEVPQAQRELVSKWANWQMGAYNATFILTSRPHGYDSTLFQGVYPLKIIDFNNDQKSEFIDNWYQNRIWRQWYNLYQGSKLKLKNVEAQSKAEAEEAAADLKRQLFAKSALNNLAKNPLLVTIIAATHEAFEFLPKERTSLYKKIFNLLLETRPNIRETRLSIKNAEDNQKVLQELALKSLEQSKLQFTPEQARPWIEAKLREKSGEPSLTPKKFLREIQNIAGLLAGGTDEGGLYQFTHKTFQEYLAALELKEQGQEDFLIEQFYNPDWQEVIVFYSTLTSTTSFLQRVLEHPSNTYQDRKYGLTLARRLVDEGGKVDKHMRQRLDRELGQVDLGDNINEIIRLEKKFQNLTQIDGQTAISEPITWGEYQLFLQDQTLGQFHSRAKVITISPGQKNQPVTGISDKDAQWFCAWLSTQANLLSDTCYDYHLPSYEEIDPTLSEVDSAHFLRIVRVEIPKHYQALLNYLANGRWREADEETTNVMREVAGQKERGYLVPEDIQKFPCEDLRIINQLWLKFSGNHFGFSVQKEIYESLGGSLIYNTEVFDRLYDRIGWTQEGKFLSYGHYTFNLNAPFAHLPLCALKLELYDCEDYGFNNKDVSFFLAQRIVTCNI